MSAPFQQTESCWGEKELSEAIFQYLEEHPQASDTLEGIAEWWIPRSWVRVEVDALQRILRQLTKSGLLEEIVVGDRACFRKRLLRETGNDTAAVKSNQGLVNELATDFDILP